LKALPLAGRRHVRAAAEVDPAALAIQADGLAGRNAGDDLGLVFLALVEEVLYRRIAREFAALHRQVLLRKLCHARFDGREVLGREGARIGEVVVEAVLDHRTDRDLRLGEQLLDRMGQQVRRGMADHLEAHGVLVGDDRQRNIAVDDERGVHHLAVDAPGERGLAQAGADAGSHFIHGYRAVKDLLTAVGQRDYGHRIGIAERP
jgi:hypothetical protein